MSTAIFRTSRQSLSGLNATFAAVLGAQWGDEGKGKLVDILSDKFNFVGRFNGGANAGHTVIVAGKKYVFHQLPSGMLKENCVNVIGNGCVIEVKSIFEELEQLKGIDYFNRFFISDRC